MQENKQYFSLAIDSEARTQLNKLAKSYKITQSEVIESLLHVADTGVAIMVLENKSKQKQSRRDERADKRKNLRKALSNITEAELLQILGEKGLI